MAGFVNYKTPTHFSSASIGTTFTGWFLERGLFVDRVEVALGGNIGAAGVNANNGIHMRAAIGSMQPTTEAVFLTMPVQLVAPASNDFAEDFITWYGRNHLVIAIQKLIDQNGLVLAVAHQSQTDTPFVMSLFCWPSDTPGLVRLP